MEPGVGTPFRRPGARRMKILQTARNIVYKICRLYIQMLGWAIGIIKEGV